MMVLQSVRGYFSVSAMKRIMFRTPFCSMNSHYYYYTIFVQSSQRISVKTTKNCRNIPVKIPGGNALHIEKQPKY
jgi:hypothetical protein